MRMQKIQKTVGAIFSNIVYFFFHNLLFLRKIKKLLDIE